MVWWRPSYWSLSSLPEGLRSVSNYLQGWHLIFSLVFIMCWSCLGAHLMLEMHVCFLYLSGIVDWTVLDQIWADGQKRLQVELDSWNKRGAMFFRSQSGGTLICGYLPFCDAAIILSAQQWRFCQCHRPVGPRRWSRRQMSCWKCHKTTMFTWSLWHTPEPAWAWRARVCVWGGVGMNLLLSARFRVPIMRTILISILFKPWNRLHPKLRGLYLHRWLC